jgi:catechol 2,3-dioxygenase-like lactoylglutathione lyase family enzyme
VCKDVSKSIAFYKTILGASHLYKDDKDFGENPAFMKVGQVQVGDMQIEFG